MANIWKKGLVNSMRMRVALALLYLLATFAIPISHTCTLSNKDGNNYHSECISHHQQSDSSVELHYTVFNQNILSGKTNSHELYCPACLYSLTYKAFKFCSKTSLCSIKTVIRIQVLPQLSFTKQLEWFCSAPLRAPPSMTS